MLDSRHKFVGTQYSMMVALLIVAFIFSPAVLLVSRELGNESVSLALACTMVCGAFAWVHREKYPRLAILLHRDSGFEDEMTAQNSRHLAIKAKREARR